MRTLHADPIATRVSWPSLPAWAVATSLLLLALTGQANAACDKMLKQDTRVSLELDTFGAKAPNPLFIVPMQQETAWLEAGECGAWAIKRHALQSSTSLNRLQFFGAPVRYPGLGLRSSVPVNPNDFLVVSVLLLKPPSANVDDKTFLGHLDTIKINTTGKYFGDLKFDAVLDGKPTRPKWRFRMVVFYDEAQPTVPPTVSLIGCADAACTPAALADGVLVATKSMGRPANPDTALVPASNDVPISSGGGKSARKLQTPAPPPSQGSTQTSTQANTQQPQKGPAALTTFVRFYDPRKGVAVGGPAVAAVSKCEDRESASSQSVSPRGLQISVLQDEKQHGSEPVGLCLVFEVAGAEKCVVVPLTDDKRPLIPSRVEIPLIDQKLPDEWSTALNCPPLPPYAVDFRVSYFDATPVPAAEAGKLLKIAESPSIPKLLGSQIEIKDSGNMVVLTKAQIADLKAQVVEPRRGRPDQAVEIDRKAFAPERIDLDPKSRTITVSLKFQAVSIGDMKFDLVKGLGDQQEAQKSCDVLLRVPRERQLGRAWSNVTKDELALKLRNKTFKIDVMPEDVPRLYVTLGAGAETAQLELKPRGSGWTAQCVVQAAVVTSKEITEGRALRDVEQPGPGFVAILTPDPQLRASLNEREQRVLYELGVDVIKDIVQRRPADKAWSLSTLRDNQGILVKSDIGSILGDTTQTDLIVKQVADNKSVALPITAVGRVLTDVLKDAKVPEAVLPTIPARILYFGKKFDRDGSLCDDNAAQTMRNWDGEWTKGGRRIMLVSVVSRDEGAALFSKKVLTDSESLGLPVYKCVSGQNSSTAHYVLQTPDFSNASNRGPLVKFLVERAVQLFDLK